MMQDLKKSLYFAFLSLDINLIVRHSTTKSTQKKDYYSILMAISLLIFF